MTDNHQFGPHFKSWRLRRGYSLKEAAGDVMSVSMLSQFESGKKTITLNKFSDLLMNLGLDIASFMTDYTGQRFDLYALQVTKGNYDQILSYYQDYPEHLDALNYLLTYYKRANLISIDTPPPIPWDFLNRLLEQDEWNLLEIETLTAVLASEPANSSLITLAKKSLVLLTDKIKADAGLNFSSIEMLLTTIILHLQVLSRAGEGELVLKAIKDLKKQLNSIPFSRASFTVRIIIIDFYKTYTLIRMRKKTEAYQSRVKIMALLNAMIDYDALPAITEELIHLRSGFMTACETLLTEYK